MGYRLRVAEMSEEKTYQPKWEKHVEYQRSKHHHHHHRDDGGYNRSSEPDKYTNKMGGALRMKDKSAYYGLMVIIVAVALFGAYKLVKMAVHEIRQMPLDDPATERSVDELRIHKVDEKNALLLGDSLAQAFQVDSSMIHRVQIETRPVYRPPRRERKWYITQREWKAIWRNLKVWRWEKRREREEAEAAKAAEKAAEKEQDKE